MRRLMQMSVYVALLAAALMALPTADARAQGIFDFLFGQPRQQSLPPPIEPRSSPPGASQSRQPGGSFTPGGPSNIEQSIGNSGTGRAAVFCVRLCDGRYFPLTGSGNATSTQLCNQFCPAAQTKVYNGSEIGRAAASDGTRYGDLKTAYMYRKSVVPNCSCNGRDAFGLASIDIKADPTFRSGDMVARTDGVVAVGRP